MELNLGKVKGKDGQDFIILGTYNTKIELFDNVIPQKGDRYYVGEGYPRDVYFYDGLKWINEGKKFFAITEGKVKLKFDINTVSYGTPGNVMTMTGAGVDPINVVYKDLTIGLLNNTKKIAGKIELENKFYHELIVLDCFTMPTDGASDANWTCTITPQEGRYNTMFERYDWDAVFAFLNFEKLEQKDNYKANLGLVLTYGQHIQVNPLNVLNIDLYIE